MRCAFTLTELLAGLSIAVIATSMLLAGISAARESARRAECQHNLRQLGVSLQQYVTRTDGVLPSHHKNVRRALVVDVGPWFDLAPLLDFDPLIPSTHLNGLGKDRHDLATLPSIFRCPSDDQKGCNYRASGGSGMIISDWLTGTNDQWVDSRNGLIVMRSRGRHISSVTDGLAYTAFASERLVAAPGATASRQIAQEVYLDVSSFVINGPPYDPLIRFVAENWNEWSKLESTGDAWHGVGLVKTAYNHVVGPNHTAAITLHAPAVSDFGIVGPSSSHFGGVNVCRADGSVSFVSDQIELLVWSELASVGGVPSP